MKKNFITLKNAKIFLIKNDRRLNAVSVSTQLLPENTPIEEFGTGAGGEIQSNDLQIKLDKSSKLYHVIVGKSPRMVQAGKYRTAYYQGYAVSFSTKEDAEIYYNLLMGKIHDLGGNIVESNVDVVYY